MKTREIQPGRGAQGFDRSSIESVDSAGAKRTENSHPPGGIFIRIAAWHFYCARLIISAKLSFPCSPSFLFVTISFIRSISRRADEFNGFFEEIGPLLTEFSVLEMFVDRAQSAVLAVSQL